MTTFLTPASTEIMGSSPMGGVIIIVLLVVLLIEGEVVKAALEENAQHWLEITRAVTFPLFVAFCLVMLARLMLLIGRS